MQRLHEMERFMEKLILVKPSKNIESSIQEYKQEFFDLGESRINGSCGITFYDNFESWLKITRSIEKETLSRDNVHASTFFTIRESDQKIIGSIQLRHSLTDELKNYGGHIGYAIRPSERKKGYGKQQLSLVLEIAKQMELSQVMVSCDKDNIASVNTIKACGGRLTEEKIVRGKMHQIYWIDLKNNYNIETGGIA